MLFQGRVISPAPQPQQGGRKRARRLESYRCSPKPTNDTLSELGKEIQSLILHLFFYLTAYLLVIHLGQWGAIVKKMGLDIGSRLESWLCHYENLDKLLSPLNFSFLICIRGIIYHLPQIHVKILVSWLLLMFNQLAHDLWSRHHSRQ